jgi:hypothetical protein
MARIAVLLAAIGLALSLAGATCNSEARPEPAPDAGPARSGPPQVLRAVDGGFRAVAYDTAAPTQDDLPGYPFDQVLPTLARQMVAFARDAFSYDGCETPLQDCLKQPAHQRHALRMLSLATTLASAGAGNTEIDTLLNKYYAAFPQSERIAFTLDKRMCRGPDDAKVTVVEFSDFECPYCRMARPMLESLAPDSGSVRLCFRPFPLKAHAHSDLAAEAAYYARAQGKFWEMHDAMFDHQDALELADSSATRPTSGSTRGSSPRRSRCRRSRRSSRRPSSKASGPR